MVLNRENIITKLKELKPIYEKEGIVLLGLFGSYAKDKQTRFSDIDVAYRLEYDKFSQNYIGGFSKILRIDAIKEELQSIFHKQIDLVPNSNKSIVKDIIYV